jgi:hypothetical protein
VKLPERAAKRSAAFFSRTFDDRFFFASIAVCFPAFLLQKDARLLAAETIFFCLAALARRGSVRLLSHIVLVPCVTAFALFAPFGKVLFTIGKFPVTQGALDAGLRRALVLCGMVFMSQTAVSSGVALPGKAGAFLSRMFFALDAITGEKIPFVGAGKGAKRFSFETFIGALDERLVAGYKKVRDGCDAGPGDASRCENPAGGNGRKTRTPLGWAIAIAVPATMYALLAVR